MKKIFRALALGLMGLAVVSCSKDHELSGLGDNPQTGIETKSFSLGASMGEVEFLPLANNTRPEGSDEDLRATLHSKAGANWVTTSYKWDDFGTEAGKVNARWGVLLGADKQVDAKSCTNAVQNEITDAPIPANTIWYNDGGGATTLTAQSVKMYCQTGEAFGTNVNKSWMCLDGRPGGDSGVEQSKQYFKIGDTADPNEEIVGLPAAGGANQEGRHIPVMTNVRDYDDFKQQEGGAQGLATFAPRGSLIGLIVNNKLGANIKIKAIIVAKDKNALDFSGYFDFNVTGNDPIQAANFVAEYPSSAGSALVLPVKNDAGATIAKDAQDKIFYVWGIQKASEKGKPFRVQLRYDLNGKEMTSRTFRVYPAASKAALTSNSKFVEGKAYKTILNLDAIQQDGGSVGSDWIDGENYVEHTKLNAINPLALVAKYDIAKVDAPINIDESRELKFVADQKIKVNGVGDVETDYANFIKGQDVGIYTWAEAMRLFGYDVEDNTAPQYDGSLPKNQWFEGSAWDTTLKDRFYDKNSDIWETKYKTISGQDYYLPNRKELNAIIPFWISQVNSMAIQTKDASVELQLVIFTNDWADHLEDEDLGVRRIGQTPNKGYKEGLKLVQIGDVVLDEKDYYDEYLTKEVGSGTGNYVTYAKRFIGTKFESAWRYEYKKADLVNGGNRLVIKNVMLWKNSGKSLVTDISTEAFFDINNSIERSFPAYGYIPRKHDEFAATTNSTVAGSGAFGYRWSSTMASWRSSYNLRFREVNGGAYIGNDARSNAFSLRPFVRH